MTGEDLQNRVNELLDMAADPLVSLTELGMGLRALAAFPGRTNAAAASPQAPPPARCPECKSLLTMDGNPPTPSGCSNENCPSATYPAPGASPGLVRIAQIIYENAFDCKWAECDGIERALWLQVAEELSRSLEERGGELDTQGNGICECGLP